MGVIRSKSVGIFEDEFDESCNKTLFAETDAQLALKGTSGIMALK